MLNFKEEPYGLLLVAAIAFSLAIIFLPIAEPDFQDKAMFGVPIAVFNWAIPLLLITFWILYLLMKRFLFSKVITWTHVLITVSTTVLIFILLCIAMNPLESAAQDYFGTHGVEIIGSVIQIMFCLFVFGQVAFLINVLGGLFKKFA